MLQQMFFATIVLQPLICPQPDAVTISIYLAPSLARSAAWSVALVLRALRFGAEKRDVGQGTVAAIFASIEDRFTQMFRRAQQSRSLHRISCTRARLRAPFG